MPLSRSARLKLLMGGDELPLRPASPDQAAPKEEVKQEPVTEQVELVEPALTTEDDIFGGEDYRNDDFEVVGVESADEAVVKPEQIFTTTGEKGTASQTTTEGVAHRENSESDLPVVIPIVEPSSSANIQGELSPPGLAFCPVKAVEKYPYRYVNKAGQDRVASGFFAGGKFWERYWDLYYIHPPSLLHPTSTGKPLILIPAHQVQSLLHEINLALHTDLVFPHGATEIGFILSFPDDRTPRPRYLGRSRSKLSYEKLEKMTPKETFRPEAAATPEVAKPTDRSVAAWRTKIELALEATKNSKKASKVRKKEERVQKQQSWNRQLKRSQRYLGLRPRSSTADGIPSIPQGPENAPESEEGVRRMSIPPLDVSVPPPYPPDSAPVMIAVDVESFEHNHSLITEIGISTLDTQLLSSVAPGDAGENWHPCITTRHFRIKEYAHLTNKDFLDGCAERFEFGASEWISIKDAARVVASCFRAASSLHHTTSDVLTNHVDPHSYSRSTSTSTGTARNIILVGHDTSMDISYLRALGYDPLSSLPTLLEVLDTSSLYRSLKREVNPRSLGHILYDLGLVGWNLHNAGNDACYTLHALVGICVKSMTGDVLSVGREAQEERVRRAEEEARARAEEEGEGWSSDGEGSDGGEPQVEGVAGGGRKAQRERERERDQAKDILARFASAGIEGGEKKVERVEKAVDGVAWGGAT